MFYRKREEKTEKKRDIERGRQADATEIGTVIEMT